MVQVVPVWYVTPTCSTQLKTKDTATVPKYFQHPTRLEAEYCTTVPAYTMEHALGKLNK